MSQAAHIFSFQNGINLIGYLLWPAAINEIRYSLNRSTGLILKKRVKLTLFVNRYQSTQNK